MDVTGGIPMSIMLVLPVAATVVIGIVVLAVFWGFSGRDKDE